MNIFSLCQNTIALDEVVSAITACTSSCFFVPLFAVIWHWGTDSVVVKVCSVCTFATITIIVSLNTEWVVIFYFNFHLARNTFSINQFVSFFAYFTGLSASLNRPGPPFALGVNVSVNSAVINNNWRNGDNNFVTRSGFWNFVAFSALSTFSINVGSVTVCCQSITVVILIKIKSSFAFHAHFFASVNHFGVELTLDINIAVFSAVVNDWRRNSDNNFVTCSGFWNFVAFSALSTFSINVGSFTIFGQGDTFVVSIQVESIDTALADLFASGNPFAPPFSLNIKVSVFGAVVFWSLNYNDNT